jgi:5-methylthioribose kinase
MSKNGGIEIDASQLFENLKKIQKQIEESANYILQVVMTDTETFGKKNAPWTDRTSFARREIYAEIQESNNHRIVGIFGGNANYMKYLEYAHGGKYAIVKHMIEYARSKYRSLISKILKR